MSKFAFEFDGDFVVAVTQFKHADDAFNAKIDWAAFEFFVAWGKNVPEIAIGAVAMAEHFAVILYAIQKFRRAFFKAHYRLTTVEVE